MERSQNSILILDDEEYFAKFLTKRLSEDGYQTFYATTPQAAYRILADESIKLLLLDLGLGDDIDGFDMLRAVKKQFPKLGVIIVTGNGDINKAVECIKEDAYDYSVKGTGALEDISSKVERFFKSINLYEENEKLKSQIECLENYAVRDLVEIVGQSPSIQTIISQIKKIAATDITILIEGESGTGKQLFAELIHKLDSKRRNKTFLEVNCGAIPKELVEREFFGHKKGAFTDAHKDSPGRFIAAHGGVLFLDEINSLDMGIQVKLLDAIENKRIMPVGAVTTTYVDVRIIAASNENLEEKVFRKEFREDLFYRLNNISIQIPPLRDRKEDIPLLIKHFLKKHSNGHEYQLTEDVMEYLMSLKWVGNVRELQNFINRLVTLSDSQTVNLQTVKRILKAKPSALFKPIRGTTDPLQLINERGYHFFRESQEKALINYFLEESSHSLKKASEKMRVNYPTFHSMIRKYNISKKKKIPEGSKDVSIE